MFRRIKNIYHLLQAILANIYYGFPVKNLIVIGVTGTDGKTTTVNMIYHILKKNEFDVSLISTVGAYINGEKLPLGFHVTNPSSFALQKFIKKIIKTKSDIETDSKQVGITNSGKKYLVLEVSSHGIDQNRNYGIKFEVSGITNITHEHLDYHKTYENYVFTKSKIIRLSKFGFINKDDASYKLLISNLKGFENKIKTYSLNREADFTLSDFPFIAKIKENYNQYNALLASNICFSLGLSKNQIEKAFQTFKYPVGRFEIVYKKDFMIIIDFAHTPNAFLNVLPIAKKYLKNKGRLIHLFGVAGKRDQTKRKEMGKISSQFADKIILTAEDPRDESIRKINGNVKENINKNFLNQITEIDDRQKAIEFAIKNAKKDDVLILTGKAHEQSMNLGHGETAWNEFEIVKKTLIKFGK